MRNAILTQPDLASKNAIARFGLIAGRSHFLSKFLLLNYIGWLNHFDLEETKRFSREVIRCFAVLFSGSYCKASL